MALLRAESELLNGRVIVKRPGALNADNQIPLAADIRQLIVIAFMNGEAPHRWRNNHRSNAVQPGLELLPRYQVVHGS